MSLQKTIAQTFLTMMIQGQVQHAFDRYTTDTFTHHNQHTPPGKIALITGMQSSYDSFPNKEHEIQIIIEEADIVMCYSMIKFTPDHTGIKVVHIMRFVHGQIDEMRDITMQLGDQ